jgi:hypothetical protein
VNTRGCPEYSRLPRDLRLPRDSRLVLSFEAFSKIQDQASRTSGLIHKASSPTSLPLKFQIAIGWGSRSYPPSFFGINSKGYCALPHSLEHNSFWSTVAAVLLALVHAFHSNWDLLLGQLVDHLRRVLDLLWDLLLERVAGWRWHKGPMEELRALNESSREKVHTLYLKTMYILWNAKGRELVDPHRWLVKYLDYPLNRKGLNPHMITMVRLFCKLCKEELGFTKALTRKERRWLSMIMRRQLSQWSCHLQGACDNSYLKEQPRTNVDLSYWPIGPLALG